MVSPLYNVLWECIVVVYNDIFRGLGPLPPMNPLDFMYACMHKKRRETRK